MEVRISSSGSSRKEGSNNSSNRRAVGSSRQGSDQAATPANSMKEDMVVVNEEKGIFGMVDLMRAAAEVLGNGSLGSAYKAVMGTGVAVVVKRMTEKVLLEITLKKLSESKGFVLVFGNVIRFFLVSWNLGICLQKCLWRVQFLVFNFIFVFFNSKFGSP